MKLEPAEAPPSRADDEEAAQAMVTILRSSPSPTPEEPSAKAAEACGRVCPSGTTSTRASVALPQLRVALAQAAHHFSVAATLAEMTAAEPASREREAFKRRGRPCDACRSVRKRCELAQDGRSCARCFERRDPCVFSDPVSRAAMPLAKRPLLVHHHHRANHRLNTTSPAAATTAPIPAVAIPLPSAPAASTSKPSLILADIHPNQKPAFTATPTANATASSPSSEPRIAKTRRHAACTTCHTKKTKCDMRKPACTNCLDRNKPCVYPLPPPHGGDGEPRKMHFTLPRGGPAPFEARVVPLPGLPRAHAAAAVAGAQGGVVKENEGRRGACSPDPGYFTSSGAESGDPLSSPLLRDASLQAPLATTFPSAQLLAEQDPLSHALLTIPSSPRIYSPAYFESDPAFSTRFTSKKDLKQASTTASLLASHPHLSLADLVLDRLPRNKPGAPRRRLRCGKLWILDPETAEKVYFCPLCSKNYSTGNGLKYHLSLHAPEEVAQIPGGWFWSREVDVENKAFCCVVEGCGKSYSSGAGLKYHLAKNVHGPVSRGHQSRGVERDEGEGGVMSSTEDEDDEDGEEEVEAETEEGLLDDE
ncbi:hypothetical protein BC830DRAFT_1170115 [Chytriomyces sp. MP71]|nr:hypothetical protein BC830DRAFT_1170115 [Chytriomyces sp. MP71]